MSEETTTLTTSNSVPTSPSESTASPSKELTLVAGRLLRKPDRLEKLCRKQLMALEGPDRLELMIELSEQTQERGEVAASCASVLRRIAERWTDKDLEEMGVDRATAEERVGLHLGLIPLAELDTGVKRRKRLSERRISIVWEEEWQNELKDILPKYPSETFLRQLAVFAENHTLEWSKAFFKYQIEARLERPRSRKDPYLTSRYLVTDGDLPVWQKRRITEIEEEECDSSLADTGEATISPVVEGNAQTDSTSTTLRLSLSSSSQQEDTPIPTSISRHSSSLSLAPTFKLVELGKVIDRKRKVQSKARQSPVKCRKKVKIPIIINLDVDDKLKEMKEIAEREKDEQKLKDMPYVMKALSYLGEQHEDEVVCREVWERRAAMVFEALSLRIE